MDEQLFTPSSSARVAPAPLPVFALLRQTVRPCVWHSVETCGWHSALLLLCGSGLCGDLWAGFPPFSPFLPASSCVHVRPLELPTNARAAVGCLGRPPPAFKQRPYCPSTLWFGRRLWLFPGLLSMCPWGVFMRRVFNGFGVCVGWSSSAYSAGCGVVSDVLPSPS